MLHPPTSVLIRPYNDTVQTGYTVILSLTYSYASMRPGPSEDDPDSQF